MGDWTTIIGCLIAALPGLVALYENRKKNAAEAGKVEAETESIHAQVADRWAEHVTELMGRLEKQEALIRTLLDEREQDKAEIKGLRLDIAQVRRASEEYRAENEDLKDWAERLNFQFITHLPDIEPEKFIRRPEKETQPPYTQE